MGGEMGGDVTITADRRSGITPAVSIWLAVAAGVAALLAGSSSASLLLDNAHGPFGDFGPLDGLPPVIGRSTAYACGVATGLAAFGVTWQAARRSRWLVVGLLAVASVVAWVLYPQPIDVSESFLPRPNERYSCTGWTFQHYPPATMDASATLYCIGVERPIGFG